MSSAEQRAEQLQTALDRRIVIEQAKGVVCAQCDITVDEAFDAIRRHARNNGRKIHEVARSVVQHGAEAITDA